MKVALIADTHYGVRNDHPLFIQQMDRFIDEVFIPTCREQAVGCVIHLGDLVDRRKYINFVTANHVRSFLWKLGNTFRDSHMIAGNHDEYYKNTARINALDELVDDEIITTYLIPEEIKLDDGTRILLVPWINEDNYRASIKAIEDSKAPICIGHFDLSGFEMYRGSVQEHGTIDPQLLSKFDQVFSGHFHHRSTKGNITYVGAAGEYIWSDHDDPRGFTIFDTTTRESQFIQNPFTLFRKVHYDDTEPVQLALTTDELVPSTYEDRFVKVIVGNKTNPYTFDKFIDKLEACKPADLLVVEDHLNLDELDYETGIVSEAQDTQTIFRSYIRALPEVDVDRLEAVVIDLYREAAALE